MARNRSAPCLATRSAGEPRIASPVTTRAALREATPAILIRLVNVEKLTPKKRDRLQALRVAQWLPEWDQVLFRPSEHRRRPPDHFWLFSMPATDLQRLTGVYQRSVVGGKPRRDDLAIQRQQNERRVDEIARYVHLGFPLSDIVDTEDDAAPYASLRKPGWLATAIVVNVIPKGDRRGGRTMLDSDAVRITSTGDTTGQIDLPSGFRRKDWHPRLAPFEVIDGQHRLWAFKDAKTGSDFELPVVAFAGLDMSWQAYLFWTINITPKRINPSLAFDLYPLLRAEDWLERHGGEKVYRETRAQEMVEALWSHPDSPWKGRINMLGESGAGHVSQAAWVRALLASFVKSWENRRARIGGIYGAPTGSQKAVLPWGRAQQAAVLIYLWRALATAVHDSSAHWATELRRPSPEQEDPDPALFGRGALLSTDQGVRGVLYVANDLLYVMSDRLDLANWTVQRETAATDIAAVGAALRSLQAHKAGAFLRELTEMLVRFDWRTSSAPGLTKAEQTEKAALRGSGGYKDIRQQLLQVLAKSKGVVGRASKEVIGLLPKS